MEDNLMEEELEYKAQTCPFLGLKEDPATAGSYPSLQNCCFHAKPPMTVRLEYQGTTCLTENHINCEVYNQKTRSALPVNLRQKHAKGGETKTLGKASFWAILLVGLIVGLAVWQVSSRGLAVLAFRGHPSEVMITGTSTSTRMQVSPATPTQVQNTPTFTLFVLTPTPILSTETPTPTEEPIHALETPIGLADKLVIHRMLAGESLPSIAKRYWTTVEAIEAVNYYLPIPLLVDWLVIIPINQTDVHQLPAFEAYSIKSDVAVETLAQQLSIDPALLKQYNDLKDGEILRAGEWILVPHPGTPTP